MQINRMYESHRRSAERCGKDPLSMYSYWGLVVDMDMKSGRFAWRPCVFTGRPCEGGVDMMDPR